MTLSPVVLVLGPTASGKSAAAFEIARAMSGEIVSGDAFAVYRGLDIGTAKPPEAWRREVPHHLIDVVDASEPYSAGKWAFQARAAVMEIEARRRLPVIAGGSHFYLRSLLGELPGAAVAFPGLRSYFTARQGPEENGRRKRALDLLDPSYSRTVPAGDTSRLERALEIVFSTGRRVSERQRPPAAFSGQRRWLKIALQIPREAIYTRIDRRIMEMWRAGWPREVEGLLRRNVPITASCFRAIGYREIARFLSGGKTEEETLAEITKKTRHLVKRQKTWLASEPGVVFLPPEDAVESARRWIHP
ncbi:MAG: tRNA (adenosine(37)-N6)-dimethylallyltransferase MiaA [Thermoanaerobaculia bacterium]